MKRKYKDEKGYTHVKYSKAIIPVGPPLKKRKYAVVMPKQMSSGAISKFTKRSNSGEEIKTLDLNFSGAYNATYTADTQPQQTLNCSSSTQTIQALNLIQQGAGISQRIGHKVSLKSLRLRFNILSKPSAVSTVLSGSVRVLVIYDRNPEGTYPATNAILSNSVQSNQITNGTYLDNLNPNFFDRMVILMDKWISLPPLNTGGLTNEYYVGPTETCNFHVIDEYINLKSLECVYGNQSNGSATTNPLTIAYIQTGALYIMALGDMSEANTSYSLAGTCRLRFRDN